MLRFTFLLLAAGYVLGDVYFHNPRGSNNRLKETSAQRQNANRVFDSQNNNRGGYNVGDATAAAHGNDESLQYNMKYFQSSANLKSGKGRSFLTLEWTNQHGCGGNEASDPHKQNCNIVLQYMCQPNTVSNSDKDRIRNGVNGATQDHTPLNNQAETKRQKENRKGGNVKINRAVNEPWEWYDKCYLRERNKGLFTADQILKNNNGQGTSSAIYTRQNPNGNRRGYECPEERDYYPYWHPTPWKDIAVLAENCNYFKSKSFNVQPYGECVEFYSTGIRKHWSKWNNKTGCESVTGNKWVMMYNYLEKDTGVNSEAACLAKSNSAVRYIWGIPYDTTDGTTKECLVALEEPECKPAPWSRSNHLGNSRDGVPSNYTWTLPYFPSGVDQRCVVRIRYNISTDDYDPYTTNSSHNKNVWAGVRSPVEQNPVVEVGAGHSPLRLAINTAQFGRTFQDRSHVIILRARPKNVAGIDDYDIYNLNVRGKRGNIVQVYPAVEYDFIPNDLTVKENDLIHIQWTGSNTHNNGNPAGDGQAGDAGEGTGGTDRSNIVEIKDLNASYPVPYEKSTMWTGSTVVWTYHGKIGSAKNLALNAATSGYYECSKSSDCSESVERKRKVNNLLNNAPASYEGVLLKFKKGKYHYMCSRNNNFTNRSQKGTVTVK